MIAAVAEVTVRWGKDIVRNVMLWLMLALPTGIAWTVMHTGMPGAQTFGAIWLVFAQLMCGLMVASGHWLEEREQGTWQALLLSPVPVGWLLFAQAALITLVTLVSQLAVFAVNRGAAEWSVPLVVAMLLGAAVTTVLGVLIGIASRSARSGNMLATVVMMALFLASLMGAGFSHYPLLEPLLRWVPSILSLKSVSAGLSGTYPAAATGLGLAFWLAAAITMLHLVLRHQYRAGT